MTVYETMLWANLELIKGTAFPAGERDRITAQLLAGVCDSPTADRFYRSMKLPNNTDANGRRMYPMFYIPPYNDGRKHRTVTCITPKTHILSANAYELEILRLLHIF